MLVDPPSPQGDDGGEQLRAGGIAGIVIGGTIACALLALLAFFVVRARARAWNIEAYKEKETDEGQAQRGAAAAAAGSTAVEVLRTASAEDVRDMQRAAAAAAARRKSEGTSLASRIGAQMKKKVDGGLMGLMATDKGNGKAGVARSASAEPTAIAATAPSSSAAVAVAAAQQAQQASRSKTGLGSPKVAAEELAAQVIDNPAYRLSSAGQAAAAGATTVAGSKPMESAEEAHAEAAAAAATETGAQRRVSTIASTFASAIERLTPSDSGAAQLPRKDSNASSASQHSTPKLHALSPVSSTQSVHLPPPPAAATVLSELKAFEPRSRTGLASPAKPGHMPPRASQTTPTLSTAPTGELLEPMRSTGDGIHPASSVSMLAVASRLLSTQGGDLSPRVPRRPKTASSSGVFTPPTASGTASPARSNMQSLRHTLSGQSLGAHSDADAVAASPGPSVGVGAVASRWRNSGGDGSNQPSPSGAATSTTPTTGWTGSVLQSSTVTSPVGGVGSGAGTPRKGGVTWAHTPDIPTIASGAPASGADTPTRAQGKGQLFKHISSLLGGSSKSNLSTTISEKLEVQNIEEDEVPHEQEAGQQAKGEMDRVVSVMPGEIKSFTSPAQGIFGPALPTSGQSRLGHVMTQQTAAAEAAEQQHQHQQQLAAASGAARSAAAGPAGGSGAARETTMQALMRMLSEQDQEEAPELSATATRAAAAELEPAESGNLVDEINKMLEQARVKK